MAGKKDLYNLPVWRNKVVSNDNNEETIEEFWTKMET